MKMRLVLSGVISLLLVMAIAAGCSNDQEVSEETPADINETGYPIVEEPITLEMMGQSSPIQPAWGEMGFFNVMSEMTNIDFSFRTSTSEDYQQKKQLAFASLDLPDLFYGAELTADEEVDYGSQGMLIPLEDLIEDYAPNLQKLMEEHPDIKPSITTPDGHIYALPGLDTTTQSKTPIMWMNGPWLENLGLDRPSTTDELYELLKTFKEQDPNQNGQADEIPLSAANVLELRTVLLPNFGIVQRDGFYEEDGTVSYAFVQEEYKAYLSFLNRLYEEELLDNEIFSHTWEQYVAKGSNDTVGIFPTWPIVMVGFEDPTEALNYPVLPALTSPTNNEKLVLEMPEVRRGRFAITSENEHPEATMRWIDYSYSEEGTILARLGIEGETYEWLDEGKTKWTLLAKEGLSTTQTNAQAAPGVGTNVPMVISQELFAKEDNPTIHAINDQLAEEYLPYAKLPYPLVYFTIEEQGRANTLRPDIETFVEQMEAKFISGSESLEDGWDGYVRTLNDLGVEELVEIYQAAYDRWEEAR